MLKKKINSVILPVEITSRELNAKLYLAHRLASKGINVFLGSKFCTKKIANYLGQNIYFDKGYHKGVSEHLYKELHKKKNSIILLDEENGVDFEDLKMLDHRIPSHILNCFEKIFLWGSKQFYYLKNRNKCRSNEIFKVTGHPRFDLLKKQNLKFYEGKQKKIKNKYGDFILFATDNKFSNNINTKKEVLKNYENRYEDLKNWMSYSDSLMQKNFKLIREIYRNTKFNIIIRPHPEENLNTYIEEFKDLKDRITVIYDDSSIYWILASKFVIINHSSTGVESRMLNKITISYLPINLKRNKFPYLPVQCSECFNESSKIIKFLKKPIEKKKNFNKIFMDSFNFNFESRISSSNIIEDFLLTSYKFNNLSFTIIFKLFFLLKFYSIKNIFTHSFLSKKTDKLIIQKMKDMEKQKVIKKFNELYKIVNGERLEILSFDNELYLIRKKN
ncbi:MAG: hypothetical protein CMM91_01740 [Rickettsiales bacterium]|nr:hypothetical protein [Rickettsiales bacterium]|tara:strand:- start:5108 stop:6445 length:1338 start_codon:yes stop_codon:yes gene_type:complete